MRIKKRKYVAIPNESQRKATLEEGRDCLFRKAKELSTLCDVEVGVIVQDQEKKDVFVWPAHHEAEELLMRFLNVPDIDRNRKLSTQESFLRGTVSQIADHRRRAHKKNDKKEREYLMHKLMKGKISINELDMMQTNGLIQLMLDKMKQCNRRIVELDMLEEQENQSLPTANQHLPSLVQTRGQNKAGEVWGSGMNAIFPAPELIEDYENNQRFSGCDSNAIIPDKSQIRDFKNDQMFFDSQTKAYIPNPRLTEYLKNDNRLIEMMFDKQSNSFPSCASDTGFHRTTACSNEGNNMVNHNTAGSSSGGNHMDITAPNVADLSFGTNDGFPEVEWPYIFLP